MSDTGPLRQVLTREAWQAMAAEADPPLLALWADTQEVHALLQPDDGVLLVSTAVVDGGYPALSPMRPSAAWFERMVADLWGHAAIGGTDQRAWLDHGRWGHSAPMAVRPGPPASAENQELAMPDGLDQIPLGPIRGGIEPAAHFRLRLRGQAIERVELRLGYAHKGVLALMRAKSPRAAARFAARLAGETTVAHSLAFARATEAALVCEVPPRAAALREAMALVEQILWRLDLASTMAEADGLSSSRTARCAEALRAAANAAFGHRLMMDCVVPGGVALDIAPDGPAAIQCVLDHLPVEEVGEAVRALQAVLEPLPEGAITTPLPVASGEGIGHAPGPAGDIWHWLRLDHGQIASVFMYDPGWARWARVEAAVAGALPEDLARHLASLGLSSSGVDL
jgi:Ni,Fe-hydrogenase III large subunit